MFSTFKNLYKEMTVNRRASSAIENNDLAALKANTDQSTINDRIQYLGYDEHYTRIGLAVSYKRYNLFHYLFAFPHLDYSANEKKTKNILDIAIERYVRDTTNVDVEMIICEILLSRKMRAHALPRNLTTLMHEIVRFNTVLNGSDKSANECIAAVWHAGPNRRFEKMKLAWLESLFAFPKLAQAPFCYAKYLVRENKFAEAVPFLETSFKHREFIDDNEFSELLSVLTKKDLPSAEQAKLFLMLAAITHKFTHLYSYAITAGNSRSQEKQRIIILIKNMFGDLSDCNPNQSEIEMLKELFSYSENIFLAKITIACLINSPLFLTYGCILSELGKSNFDGAGFYGQLLKIAAGDTSPAVIQSFFNIVPTPGVPQLLQLRVKMQLYVDGILSTFPLEELRMIQWDKIPALSRFLFINKLGSLNLFEQSALDSTSLETLYLNLFTQELNNDEFKEEILKGLGNLLLPLLSPGLIQKLDTLFSLLPLPHLQRASLSIIDILEQYRIINTFATINFELNLCLTRLSLLLSLDDIEERLDQLNESQSDDKNLQMRREMLLGDVHSMLKNHQIAAQAYYNAFKLGDKSGLLKAADIATKTSATLPQALDFFEYAIDAVEEPAPLVDIVEKLIHLKPYPDVRINARIENLLLLSFEKLHQFYQHPMLNAVCNKLRYLSIPEEAYFIARYYSDSDKSSHYNYILHFADVFSSLRNSHSSSSFNTMLNPTLDTKHLLYVAAKILLMHAQHSIPKHREAVLLEAQNVLNNFSNDASSNYRHLAKTYLGLVDCISHIPDIKSVDVDAILALYVQRESLKSGNKADLNFLKNSWQLFLPNLSFDKALTNREAIQRIQYLYAHEEEPKIVAHASSSSGVASTSSSVTGLQGNIKLSTAFFASSGNSAPRQGSLPMDEIYAKMSARKK